MTEPLVTVSVLTYNSAKYVLETLESIKAQTYPNLLLQVCDDCSTDNTIELCEKWIAENKDRFTKIKFVIPKQNTGVSGNANRAWDACETEWYKIIAGDDILLPNCIEEYMNFISAHPDTVFLFSKVECFGPNEDCVHDFQNLFDYSFFNMSNSEQLDRLIIKGNCIPAATLFCNINVIRQIDLRHDERIPLLEDIPLWVNVIKAGVDLCFVDKTLVKYRVGNGLSTTNHSCNFILSRRLFYIYYVIPYWMERNPAKVLDDLASHETYYLKLYYELLESKPVRLRNNIVAFINKLLALFHLSHD